MLRVFTTLYKGSNKQCLTCNVRNVNDEMFDIEWWGDRALYARPYIRQDNSTVSKHGMLDMEWFKMFVSCPILRRNWFRIPLTLYHALGGPRCVYCTKCAVCYLRVSRDMEMNTFDIVSHFRRAPLCLLVYYTNCAVCRLRVSRNMEMNTFDIVSHFRRASLCLLHKPRGVIFKGVA